jgi:putative PIN family toxin of toxin-antitoxin system
MRITLDTNVLISSLIVPDGSADRIIDLIRGKRVELVLSPFILEELTRVLTLKFKLPSKAVRRAVRRTAKLSTIIQPDIVIESIKQKQDDNRILECAVSGKVDYLITGDKKHILPLGSIRGIPIITITSFLKQRD